MKMKYKHQIRFVCVVGMLLSFGSPLSAQTAATVFEPIHWAYSTFFGTGWYEIGDNRSIFALRIPPRQTLRKSDYISPGKREIGIEIKYPLTLGFHNLDDLPAIIHGDNFGTVSFTPGVELEIPINERWYLRPFANIGFGVDLNSSDSVWIYYTGVKSRYTFSNEKFDWALLNSLIFAGFTPDKGDSDSLAVAEIGVEFRHPLKTATLGGRPIDLHYNLMYTFHGNALHFGLPDGEFDVVKGQFKAAVAMSFRDGPKKLWFFNIHRLELGYKFTSNGNFRAFTFSTRSWFTK
jgi:hypothetical protein